MYICIRVCTHFIFIIIKYATTILSCCMITPRFLHSPMITRNTNDQEIRSCHLKFTNCDWMASQPNKLWCTCITSNNLSLQMVNYGLLNRLINCKNLAFTCPLTPKQAPERQIVFMSFVFCLHWWQDVPCKHSLVL